MPLRGPLKSEKWAPSFLAIQSCFDLQIIKATEKRQAALFCKL